MTTVTEYSISSGTLVELIGEVFVGLFGEDRGRPYEDNADVAMPVAARVSVSGQWSCDIDIAGTDGLVTLAASELFGVAPEEVSDADRRDVIGELANVVGGNVKSMMPGPSVLSLPVAETASTAVAAPSIDGLLVDLTWCRQRLRVSLSNARATAPTA